MPKLFILALLVCVFASNSFAEFECAATVSYKWKKKTAANVSPAADMIVDTGRVLGAGADEVAAKAKLNQLLPDARTKASESCKKNHESTADCLSAKYASMSSTINSLRFEARKSLEEAISQDCDARAGECLDVAVSEIQCAEKVIPGAMSPTPAGSGKGAKK